MESREFEFDTSQNELFSDLAKKMSLLGFFLIIAGAITIFSGIFGQLKGLGSIVAGVLYILMGIWTRNASNSFNFIVNTEGNDIANLMGALGQLRKLYTLQYWAVIVTLVFAVLALVLTIILGISIAR